MKDVIIPIVRCFEDDPHLLWFHLKKRFESRAVQHKLILTKQLSNIKMIEGMTVEEYYRSDDEIVAQLAGIHQVVKERVHLYCFERVT